MTDIWETKNIRPMLIGTEGQPFDSDEYIYELKLDGERCIAYLDRDKTILKNKRNILMLPKVPELAEIHKNVNVRCILDGELAVIKDGRPDFFEIQERSMMSNPVKIDMAAKKYPACFTAFDILYYENRQVTDLPLTERKELLQKAVISETADLQYRGLLRKTVSNSMPLPNSRNWRVSLRNVRTASITLISGLRTGSKLSICRTMIS